MFAAGPITRELSGTFDEFWNNGLSIPAKALSASQSSHKALHDYREELAEDRGRLKAEGVDYLKRVASGEPFEGMIAGSARNSETADRLAAFVERNENKVIAPNAKKES